MSENIQFTIKRTKDFKVINLGKITNYDLIPDLISIQFRSYDEFLQKDVDPKQRENKGLEQVFREAFPIETDDTDDQNGVIVEYDHYKIQESRWSPLECKNRGLTYGGALKVVLKIFLKKTGEIRLQEVYFGEIPLMTPNGTFIINGAERVVVSQLHRSPGIFFFYDQEKNLYTARVIPYKGSWLEIELDPKDVLYIKVDKRKRIPATIFLRALVCEEGTNEEVLKLFYETEKIDLSGLKKKQYSKIIKKRVATDIIDPESGEIIFEAGDMLDEDSIQKLKDIGIEEVEILKFYTNKDDTIVINTLQKDEVKNKKEAVMKFIQYVRGDNYDYDDALEIIESMFFDEKNYDLSPVGRHKINNKFKYISPQNFDGVKTRTLRKEDIIETFKYFLKLVKEVDGYELDDIDHLGNRRVRSVGELLANQLRQAFAKMERSIKEKLASIDRETITPTAVVSTKSFASAINDFFGLGQLSQFMDQTNPLSETTHKRRLNALGPGGLNRERAGFEVRDIHYSHYGRMCPIETPEGQNIGLIVSMSTLARVNEYGFLETPYRKVIKQKDEKGRIVKVYVSNEIEYLTADAEELYAIAQANTPLNEDGTFKTKFVACRKRDDYPLLPPEEIDYMDIAPLQVVSVSTSLIPFLEHDDANRALMGSNMQRQAVPLIEEEAPFVGTGMEPKVAYDSRVCVLAEEDGVVEKVDANEIIVRNKDGKKQKYVLRKFERTNQNTTFNQKPVVNTIIFDYKEWDNELKKYIYFKEAVVKSIKKDEIEIQVTTENGKVVNVSYPLKIGEKEYEPLVNENERITKPKAIAGQKVYKEIRDKDGRIKRRATILAEGPSIDKGRLALGKNVLVAFMPWNGYNFEDAILISERLVKEDVYTSIHIEEFVVETRETKLGPEEITRDIPNISDKAFRDLDEKGVIRIGAEVRPNDILVGKVTPQAEKETTPEYKLLQSIFGEKSRDVKDTSLRVPNGVEGIVIDVKWYSRSRGDELPAGVNDMVKVFVATKRKIQVGDKMAGRHGNKGVISKVLPVEDMPFMEDGTPIDIVLNPLGVPSRMNIGQIFETMLGYAAKKLNYLFETPVFDGAKEEDIKRYLELADLPLDCKFQLYDGRTGEKFEGKVFCGYIYMMKLTHMVDDKMHARSTGPYAMVTQQPLGGKAQFGGQRLGEMEVWALEAYGAAYTLQELLSYKSDDINGRNRIYDAIIKGIHSIKPGIPESFNVLLQELRGLALDLQLLDENRNPIDISDLDEEYSKSTKSKIRIETIERN
ncbi:MAG: DNA-directed RNA polymerase subunit beta [Leptospiraceae bacterium]|nr:DNA-directed RNA polymerase subunit beta [Leptospiraceae bacterium]MDW7975164.1 DNA-directed RNA polymerase subunit beta [Leptospiraceae bacterium]